MVIQSLRSAPTKTWVHTCSTTWTTLAAMARCVSSPSININNAPCASVVQIGQNTLSHFSSILQSYFRILGWAKDLLYAAAERKSGKERERERSRPSCSRRSASPCTLAGRTIPPQPILLYSLAYSLLRLDWYGAKSFSLAQFLFDSLRLLSFKCLMYGALATIMQSYREPAPYRKPNLAG